MMRALIFISLAFLVPLSLHSSNFNSQQKKHLEKLEQRKKFDPNLILLICKHVETHHDIFFPNDPEELEIFFSELKILDDNSLAWREKSFTEEIDKMRIEYNLLKEIYENNKRLKTQIKQLKEIDYAKEFTTTHSANFKKFWDGFGDNNLSFLPSEDNLYTKQVIAMDSLLNSPIYYDDVSDLKLSDYAGLVPPDSLEFLKDTQISINLKEANAPLFLQSAKFFGRRRNLILSFKAERLMFIAMLSKHDLGTNLKDRYENSCDNLLHKSIYLQQQADKEKKRQVIGAKKLLKDKDALQKYELKQKKRSKFKTKAKPSGKLVKSSPDELNLEATSSSHSLGSPREKVEAIASDPA